MVMPRQVAAKLARVATCLFSVMQPLCLADLPCIQLCSNYALSHLKRYCWHSTFTSCLSCRMSREDMSELGRLRTV